MTEDTIKAKALALWNKAVSLVVSYPKTTAAIVAVLIVLWVL